MISELVGIVANLTVKDKVKTDLVCVAGIDLNVLKLCRLSRYTSTSKCCNSNDKTYFGFVKFHNNSCLLIPLVCHIKFNLSALLLVTARLLLNVLVKLNSLRCYRSYLAHVETHVAAYLDLLVLD